MGPDLSFRSPKTWGFVLQRSHLDYGVGMLLHMILAEASSARRATSAFFFSVRAAEDAGSFSKRRQMDLREQKDKFKFSDASISTHRHNESKIQILISSESPLHANLKKHASATMKEH